MAEKDKVITIRFKMKNADKYPLHATFDFHHQKEDARSFYDELKADHKKIVEKIIVADRTFHEDGNVTVQHEEEIDEGKLKSITTK